MKCYRMLRVNVQTQAHGFGYTLQLPLAASKKAILFKVASLSPYIFFFFSGKVFFFFSGQHVTLSASIVRQIYPEDALWSPLPLAK